MTELTIDHLGKTFSDGSVALDGIDLAIADGELLVLVGPSGCGKSTLLRCIAGLEHPTTGRVHLGGRDITGLAPERRDIAMVFQSYALYPHLTVAGNLAFPLKMAKVAKAERQRRVAELARTMAIDELLERRPAQLSGGQRQRVAMGRALIRQPEAFLMDEPLSNLDARLRGQLRREIAELQRRLGITTVYVTHDQVEAMTMGDRLCVLRGGRIQQLGSAEDCYRRPVNRFVAGFLGSPPLHLFRAGLVREEAAWSLVWDGGRVSADALADADGEDLEALAAVRDWGLRPEALRLVGDGGVASEVVHVEHLGHEHLVHCRPPWPVVDDDPEVPTGPLVVRHPAGGASPAVGDRVHLAVDTAALLAFGSDGRRVGGHNRMLR